MMTSIHNHHVQPTMLLRATIFTVIYLCSMGCNKSKELGQITGTVTINSRPVTSGAIVFEDRKRGISIRANLDENGHYHVQTHNADGLPPGVYQVAISSTRVGSGNSPFVGGEKEPTPAATGPKIPVKYHKVTTSRLSIEIVQGANVEDFALN